jgi:hypothetical protein
MLQVRLGFATLPIQIEFAQVKPPMNSHIKPRYEIRQSGDQEQLISFNGRADCADSREVEPQLISQPNPNSL